MKRKWNFRLKNKTMCMLSKTLLMILTAIIAFGLVACAGTSHNKAVNESSGTEETNKIAIDDDKSSEGNKLDEREVGSDSTGNPVLVVYFSVTGNTKKVAEKIASVTDGDIYEIKASIEYSDADINYNDSGSRTSKEQRDSSVRPEIQSETISLEGYDTIYIGYPIWWGEEPRIMDTFVESYDFGDITMIPFCTSGSSGIGNSGKNLAENAGSGNWTEGKRFSSGVTESEIKDWITLSND